MLPRRRERNLRRLASTNKTEGDLLDFAYPRPQLQRSDWISLNGTWRFRYDDERRFSQPGEIHDWPLDIMVPYPPESIASGIADRGFHRACWYQRDFFLPLGDDRVIIRFGAVDYAARVWVNGRLAVTHEGGHTPFSADITDLVGAKDRVEVQGGHTQVG